MKIIYDIITYSL